MIAATLVVAGTIITYVGTIDLKMPLALFSASLFIATVGFADDVKSIAEVLLLRFESHHRLLASDHFLRGITASYCGVFEAALMLKRMLSLRGSGFNCLSFPLSLID